MAGVVKHGGVVLHGDSLVKTAVRCERIRTVGLTQDRGDEYGEVPAYVSPRQMSLEHQMHFLDLAARAAWQQAGLTRACRQPVVDCIALQRQSNMPGVGTAGSFDASGREHPGDPVCRPLMRNSAIGLKQMRSRTL